MLKNTGLYLTYKLKASRWSSIRIFHSFLKSMKSISNLILSPSKNVKGNQKSFTPSLPHSRKTSILKFKSPSLPPLHP